ncbi:single-stranded-DNA-specific exonuclease RecJ [Alkalicoccus urumqiensis]|uniref:Single-stranded-DNA-specific exonuclease RecJ n=1 Tax=Alkalicoccus urumqiensis TaxID=1548213 RepID=A0A2P6MFH7_ALKUR|nr:single-stranded-DNA-specific exonuclease RecJ [Alkalicoccus urumqiensis]PRO65013.1 single-stranded-DNA-specific exonuclease RecJ [Alkalicoccus urumqiensis]
MLHPEAKWRIQTPDADVTKELEARTGLSPVASRFLAQRGITGEEEVERFLNADVTQLHDPMQMKDMKKAVDRLHKAIEAGERILVYGDYDADGVTSTTVMYETLISLGAEAGWYVPDRFTEGYGPNEGAFRRAAEEGTRVIVTVDTGISAVHEADVAKELGIDLIITDHHEPPPQIPDGYAVINPKQADCGYPFDELAGVGVAWKCSQALTGTFPEQYLDLAAVGTIADLVPLEEENRVLAALGLKRLNSVMRPGLKALLKEAGADGDEVDEETVGFRIGPRLNAAGRLERADPAVQLLLSKDPEESQQLASMIDQMNRERQEIVRAITEEAIEEVEAQDGDPEVIVVGREGWNPGVIGIVASRLVETYYRPAIVLSLQPEAGKAKGSARSIEGFNMFESLSSMRELLPHFGGHAMAAGLTMELEHVDELRSRLCEIAAATMEAEDWVRKLDVDLPVGVEEISVETIRDLSRMAPFGIGNPAPKILIEQAVVETAKQIGSGRDHLKLTLTTSGHDHALDVIAFRMGEKHAQISPLARLSVVGKLSINEWNGRIKPQLIAEDMRVDERQIFDFRGSRRLKEIPGPKNALVFQEDTDTGSIPDSWSVLRPEDIDDSVTSLLFYDVPSTMEELSDVLVRAGNLERIDCVFQHDDNYFFTPLPNRDQFKWFYALVKKRGRFEMQHKEKLAEHKGWSVQTVSLICQVFSELEFVKIDNGVLTPAETPSKRKLEEAPTYKKYQQKSRIQQELCYSTFRSLVKTLDSLGNTRTPVDAGAQ